MQDWWQRVQPLGHPERWERGRGEQPARGQLEAPVHPVPLRGSNQRGFGWTGVNSVMELMERRCARPTSHAG